MQSQYATGLIDLCRQIAADAKAITLADDHTNGEVAMPPARPNDREDQNQVGVRSYPFPKPLPVGTARPVFSSVAR
jgi:hypothetical protein